MDETLEYRTKLWYALRMSLIIIALLAIVVGVVLVPTKSTTSTSRFYFSAAVGLLMCIGMYSRMIQSISDRKADVTAKRVVIALVNIIMIFTIVMIFLFKERALFVLGLGLFGLGGAGYIWIDVIKREPVIKANDEGVRVKISRLQKKYYDIPWNEIKGISLDKSLYAGSNYKFIVLQLVNPEKYDHSKNKLVTKLMGFNKKLFGGQILVEATHLNAPAEEVIAKLLKYKNRYGGAAEKVNLVESN